ncbi:hypothetical protein EJB05_24875, partial [Eragrostis curvula]
MVAALDCLAAVTFAGAMKEEEVERSMKAAWDVIISPPFSRSSKTLGRATKRSPQVLVAAVSTWTFFLTTIVILTEAPRKTDSAVWSATVASLAGLLENDDRAVRMAAGEVLAVCVELNLTQHTPRKDMDALAAKVSELASESVGKGVNNTMLPQQKNLFQQIAAFLDHDERPMEYILTSVDGCVALKVSTWTKLVQLNFLHRFLGNVFLKHVEGNELFKEAFSYGAHEGKVLSIANKKTGQQDGEGFEAETQEWILLLGLQHFVRASIHSSAQARNSASDWMAGTELVVSVFIYKKIACFGDDSSVV